LLKAQLADERRRQAILAGSQGEGGDAQRTPQLRTPPLAEEMLLLPDIARRFDASAVVYVQGHLISIGRPGIAGKWHSLRTGRGYEFAAAKKKTDFAQLRGSGSREMKEALAAQIV
jgi:hypothetical protein